MRLGERDKGVWSQLLPPGESGAVSTDYDDIPGKDLNSGNVPKRVRNMLNTFWML